MDLSKEEVIALLRSADCVCFDVDSTICPDEGIDEFAKFHGVGEAVAQLTQQAMGGKMTFQAALKARIEIIDPTMDRLKAFLESRSPKATPGAKELIERLRERNCHVHLVSGGFVDIIGPTAQALEIPLSDVHANKFVHDKDGRCLGADESLPTCRSGGKAQVIRELRQKYGYKKIIMVGDGATDLEACPPADGFIGFGANAVRPIVKERAKWFVYSFEEILKELDS